MEQNDQQIDFGNIGQIDLLIKLSLKDEEKLTLKRFGNRAKIASLSSYGLLQEILEYLVHENFDKFHDQYEEVNKGFFDSENFEKVEELELLLDIEQENVKSIELLCQNGQAIVKDFEDLNLLRVMIKRSAKYLQKTLSVDKNSYAEKIDKMANWAKDNYQDFLNKDWNENEIKDFNDFQHFTKDFNKILKDLELDGESPELIQGFCEALRENEMVTTDKAIINPIDEKLDTIKEEIDLVDNEDLHIEDSAKFEEQIQEEVKRKTISVRERLTTYKWNYDYPSEHSQTILPNMGIEWDFNSMNVMDLKQLEENEIEKKVKLVDKDCGTQKKDSGEDEPDIDNPNYPQSPKKDDIVKFYEEKSKPTNTALVYYSVINFN